MATVIFDESALRQLLNGSEVARDLARKAVAVETAAKEIATADGLVDTGRYRSSISWRLGQDGLGLFADVGSNVTYAGYLEFGTRPHIIEARRKKALWWKGADHPVRVVHHPGTKPHHVLRRALDLVMR
jgi:phage gpG-like protein